MTGKDVCLLIAQLKEENKSNTPQEREFNNQWIALLIKAMKKAVS